jgi:hypothetical protein
VVQRQDGSARRWQSKPRHASQAQTGAAGGFPRAGVVAQLSLPVTVVAGRLCGHADAIFPPRAARRVPDRAARLLHPPRRYPVRTGRRVAERRQLSVAAAPGLWWAGPGDLDLELAWRAYIRRFDLEHTIRFCKQTRPLAGRPHGRATPPRPTAGPGWCWPPTPSCAWPARSWSMRGCRGNGCGHRRGCHPTGCAAGFRDCCAHWAPRPARRNPQGAPRAAPRAAAAGLRPATRRSKAHQQAQEEQEEGDHHRQGRLTDPPSPPSDRRPRSTARRHAEGLNHKLRGETQKSPLAITSVPPCHRQVGAAEGASCKR